MSEEALQRMADKSGQLEQEGRADSEECEELSDDYQALAMAEGPLGDEVNEGEPGMPWGVEQQRKT